MSLSYQLTRSNNVKWNVNITALNGEITERLSGGCETDIAPGHSAFSREAVQ